MVLFTVDGVVGRRKFMGDHHRQYSRKKTAALQNRTICPEKKSPFRDSMGFFCFLFTGRLSSGPDGGNDKGGKSAVLALDQIFHFIDQVGGEADGLVHRGWNCGNFEFHRHHLPLTSVSPSLHHTFFYVCIAFAMHTGRGERKYNKNEVMALSDYADYKTMYYTMMQASEKAIRILIEAQRQCEEIYLNQKEPSLTLLPIEKKDPPEN